MIKLSSSSFNSHNKKPQKKNNSTLSRKRPIAKLFTIAAIGIVLVIGFVLLNSSTPKKGMNQEEQKMALYLKEKYGKEFIVENYRVEGAGLGVEGDPTAEGYPKEDRTLKFTIIDRGDYRRGEHGYYYDNYYSKVWTREFESELLPFLKNTFGYLPRHEITIGHNSFSDDKKVEQPFLDLKRALEIYKDNISMTITIDQREEIIDSSLNLHAERVYKLVDKLKTSKAKISLYYSRIIESESGIKRSSAGIHINKDKLKNITKQEIASMITVERR